MWQPSASIDMLRQRARALAKIRSFFSARDVMEVETPLLCKAAATDLHMQPITLSTQGQRHYLQTSPEFAMKRLLAANSGPIYQLCKAFREGELGSRHNPEFTILEWYQPGWDDKQLMEEVDAFLQAALQCAPAKYTTYANLFIEYLGLNPHTATDAQLQQKIPEALSLPDRNDRLDYLFSTHIEPKLGHEEPMFVQDYPASQAALAQVRKSTPPVAQRFEVYIKGIELANGYCELTCHTILRKRFIEDNKSRQAKGFPTIAIDERLLASMEAGLPACAGVALGVDRLMLLMTGASKLSDVLSFDFPRA